MDIQEIERVLTEACDEAKESGWTLQPRLTYEPEMKLCCPHGAYCQDDGSGLGAFPSWDARQAFIFGFDGREWTYAPYRDFYDLGAKFRASTRLREVRLGSGASCPDEGEKHGYDIHELPGGPNRAVRADGRQARDGDAQPPARERHEHQDVQARDVPEGPRTAAPVEVRKGE